MKGGKISCCVIVMFLEHYVCVCARVCVCMRIQWGGRGKFNKTVKMAST